MGHQSVSGQGIIKSTLLSHTKLRSRLHSNSSIKAKIDIGIRAKLLGESNIRTFPSITTGASPFVSINETATIKAKLNSDMRMSSQLSITGKLETFAEKLGGSVQDINKFLNFDCKEKLYPNADIYNDGFVNEVLESGNLYQSIDGGIVDSSDLFIQPNTPYSTGNFSYKFAVNAPTVRPQESFILFRATANIKNFSSRISPTYTLSNVKLEDPSGNLIVKYKDFSFQGDADFDSNKLNFVTYVSEPQINNSDAGIFDDEKPFFESGYDLPYIVSFDLNITCNDDPFSKGFDISYEDKCKLDFVDNGESINDYLAIDGKPISTQQGNDYSVNPSHLVKIIGIELCNSGEVASLRTNFINLYHEVVPTGLRINRTILPAKFLASDFETGIWPEENSVWVSFPNIEFETFTNTSGTGIDVLTNYIRNKTQSDSAILQFTSDVPDSGKLKLKFSHEPPVSSKAFRGGAFSFGQNTDAFNDAALTQAADIDSFFTIDEIELRIIARKANANVRNFSLDVVGYSDDKLLNVTSAVGGFLQNIEGSGALPSASGFLPTDELSISSESISDKAQYIETSSTNNAGGDHYLLSTTPIVSGIEFKEYVIPLKIYQDTVELGRSTDYSMSSYFENLYLDIFPIPSGAEIANARLIIKHKPSNALQLKILGGSQSALAHRNAKLFTNPRKGNTSGWIDKPTDTSLSILENLPHAFGVPASIKSNYSRRWRGVDGSVSIGPFNPLEYDLSFENKQLDYPFLNGYFSFTNDVNNFIVSDNFNTINTISGQYIGNYNKISNIGLRFNSTSLFSGVPTPYTTINWTSASGYENNTMYGLLSDAFNNAVRVSGDKGYINFGPLNTASGFAIFTRFSPDINISGVNYNLFNSGVLYAKYDSGKNLEFSLHYNNGKLQAQARASDGTIHTITDTHNFDEYSYPLSTLLVYNGGSDNKLRLYVENSEFGSYTSSLQNNRRLINASSSFVLTSGNSSLTFGHSSGKNIGLNAFITDIGISLSNINNQTNIIDNQTQANKLYRELSADKFLDSLYVKFDSDDAYSSTLPQTQLWSYIDEDVDDWYLGAFRHCQFNHEFDKFTKRIGLDYIVHNLTHDGSPYEDHTNITLPSNIPSGVAYHTQIENDFLRINIGSIPNTFGDYLYAADVRISKALPRNYNFEETALAVETIIEHDTYDTIAWPDGKLGPRLIVSLYTTSKEPATYTVPNIGLVTRHTHYLEPSGCIHKLKSVFNFDNLMDNSEPWSNFNHSLNLSEFIHKYYSTDIDDMFLQYDLVYPSGSPFTSKIKIHSATIKLDNALVEARSENHSLLLFSSGQFFSFDTLTLAGLNASQPLYNQFTLFADGRNPTYSTQDITLYCSGAMVSTDTLPLHTVNVGFLNSLTSNFGDMYGNAPTTFTLFTDGKFIKFNDLDLVIINKDSLPETSGIISLFTHNVPLKYPDNSTLNLYNRGREVFVTTEPSANMNLFISVDTPQPILSENVNLFINGYNPNIFNLTTSLSLFSQNFFEQELPSYPGKLQRFSWNGKNVGVDIDIEDNPVARLSADDEIRGVETICYGDCGYSGICEEIKLISHEIDWSSSTCIDGGILRSLRTYTNLEAEAFNTEIGYSGHFYGIRKYQNLVPDAPYQVLVMGRSAEDSVISRPYELPYWEYGSNSDVAFSGIKLVGDEPFIESGRQLNSHYGKAVSIKKDLAAISAPYQEIYDSEGYLLNEAGTVFVYRRNPQPSGFDWSGIPDKSSWSLETQLALPSSIIRDSFSPSTVMLENVFPAEARKWKVGQEGRQFGYSLDIAKPSGLLSLYGEDKELIVVGGPSCSWNRTFAELEPSGINICLLVFTDRAFIPVINNSPFLDLTYLDILKEINNRDLLFKYFSNPSIKFNFKIGIVQAVVNAGVDLLDFAEPKPDFIIKKNIPRHTSIDARNPALFEQTDNVMFSGIKEVFNTLFPYNNSQLNNNIPPFLGIFIDNSVSLGKDALEPAIDEFIDYYQDYSFASGLRDAFGVRDSGVVTFLQNTSTNWIEQVNQCIKDITDIDELKESNNIRFLTENILEVGNVELSEFNIPPDSGGAVYIFEKESGVWSLIQTIDSPTASTITPPDRFGHSIDISENGEIIAIGSPYIDQALSVYEYDYTAKDRLLSVIPQWISHKKDMDTSFGYYFEKYNRYQRLLQELNSTALATKALYAELNEDARYDLRTNRNIWGNNPLQEFKLKFTYNYSNINYGSWSFFTDEFAPTARLGYSVSTNDDGSIIAIGAPTDSFDEHDLSTTYYAPNRPQYTTWPSYVNTGAVRLFESRKYYPHNLAVDYGKFGNRHLLNSGASESGYFITHLGPIFNEIGVNYEAIPFAEVDIPEEAGLAFIITPEVDALSNEVLDNIKNWLALGDRNLVLVSNDPLYESSGLYRTSNEIVNNILSGLGSRLRVHAARNDYEALIDSGSGAPFINTIQSFIPTNSLSTYINAQQMQAYGVGDIKVHWPENYNSNYNRFSNNSKIGNHSIANRSYNCAASGNLNSSQVEYTYRTANSKCEMPLIHNGDLRSQWKEWCVNIMGNMITYVVNWPLFFGTVSESNYGCDVQGNINALAPQYDAVPILAAAEKITQTFIQPASPVSSGLFIIGNYPVVTERDSKYRTLGSPITGQSAFYIMSDYNSETEQGGALSGDYSLITYNLGTSIIGNQFDKGNAGFFDPSPYNKKDSILQVRQTNYTGAYIGEEVVCSNHNFMMSESYLNTSSKVIGIASTKTESLSFLDINGDINRLMYLDIIKKNGRVTLGQMGEWTGRTSFKDANPQSFLKEIFEEYYKNQSFIVVEENISTQQLQNGTSDNYPYDVLWISDATGLPDQLQLNRIKTWLASGDKKLIITYNFDVENPSYNSVSIARQLFELFNVSIKPIWLTEKNRYAINNQDFPASALRTGTPPNITVDIPNSILANVANQIFIPMCGSASSESLMFQDIEVVDNKTINFNNWRYDAGVTKIVFPAIAGSGYEIYIDLVSEHPTENDSLDLVIGNAISYGYEGDPPNVSSIDIKDIDSNRQFINIDNTAVAYSNKINSNNTNGEITTLSTKVQAIGDYISFYFSKSNLADNNQSKRSTVRVAGISGVLVNKEIIYGTTTTFIPIFDWIVTPAVPERTYEVEILRQISTDNSKYCPADPCIEQLGGQLIADGPVIAAQEYEVFSNFENGVNRSRITVISDSSLVQGKYISDENGAIKSSNKSFIQSLYPFTSFPSDSAGRYYNISHKIKCPELGSPQRYFQATGNSGINLLFNPSGIAASGKPMSAFVESFDNYEDFRHALHPIYGQDPTYITRRDPPLTGGEVQIQGIISGIKQAFRSNLSSWGAYSKFNTFINGTQYVDVGPRGGLPSIVKDLGHDFLDFDILYSGYPGDLFGYSILLHGSGDDTTLFVGAPFAGYKNESLTNWNDIINNTSPYQNISGTLVGHNGGAGSVYMYRKTNSGETAYGYPISWECVRKFRPDSINIGQDLINPVIASGSQYLGRHNYNASQLQRLSIIPDQFGSKITTDSDILAISAPGHDFGVIVDEIPNEFINKEFDLGFNISKRTYYDLGSSGIRHTLYSSGNASLNTGAVFTYENRIDNWEEKTKSWTLLEKIIPQGYNARTNAENDYFGYDIAIDRTFRNDADYTLIVGAPNHKYATSGNHITTQPLSGAGAAYVYDGMLRSPGVSFPDSRNWIKARVFGNIDTSGNPQVELQVTNSVLNESYIASGIIRSNYQGEIYIEASGQDFVEKGFINHRPYIVLLEGEYLYGTSISNALRLFTEGKPSGLYGAMNLFSNAANSAIVYNNMALYGSAIIDSTSNNINLYLNSEPPNIIQESGLYLYCSGVGIDTDTITLSIRGF